MLTAEKLLLTAKEKGKINSKKRKLNCANPEIESSNLNLTNLSSSLTVSPAAAPAQTNEFSCLFQHASVYPLYDYLFDTYLINSLFSSSYNTLLQNICSTSTNPLNVSSLSSVNAVHYANLALIRVLLVKKMLFEAFNRNLLNNGENNLNFSNLSIDTLYNAFQSAITQLGIVFI